ncbi:hypothetical protein [Streptomyces sp. NPDC047869]|uniref:hypothetical protein n=1 Tax=Streptomyces sp. NPDC047869 TaxID=3154709 RepID=UPI00345128FE
MSEPTDIYAVRAAYEASAYGQARGASSAYLRTLAEHQEAALAGDLAALRAISAARGAFALAAPEPEALQAADPEQRRMLARRTIS